MGLVAGDLRHTGENYCKCKNSKEYPTLTHKRYYLKVNIKIPLQTGKVLEHLSFDPTDYE
jgi:hypothetical protein